MSFPSYFLSNKLAPRMWKEITTHTKAWVEALEKAMEENKTRME